jgi:hypothetical protein
MPNLLRWLVAAFTVALSACATTESAPDPSAPTGMVVGSITHESSVGSYGLGIVGKPGQRIRPPSVGFGMWTPFNNEMDEDFKEKGGTYSMDLPAGEYRIVGWFVLRASTHYRSAQPFEIPFSVEPGKATYLGNLHFDKHWENVTLRDRASRDMPVLIKRVPKLASVEVTQSISPGANVERLGSGYTSQNQMPLYMPVPVRR